MKCRIETILGIALVIVGLGGSPSTYAQAPTPSRDQSVAYTLLVLTGYVGWPKPRLTATSFRIGILGADPFGGALHAFCKDQKAEGKPIEVLVIEDTEELSAASFDSMHMLFIPEDYEAEWRKIAREVDTVGLLVIGEGDDGVFTDKAAFNIISGATDLQIDHRQARRARLKVSSRLASIVRRH